MRLIRRLLVTIAVLLVLMGLGVWGAVRYAAPQEELNLESSPLLLEKKVLEMAIELKPEMTLSSEELNQLIKGYLRQNPRVGSHLLLDGADFNLEGNLLSARVNVTYMGLVQAGATAQYEMSWHKPYLRAIPQRLTVRSLDLPASWLEAFEVPLNKELPEWVKISKVAFDDSQIRVGFQAAWPSAGWMLERLRELRD